MVIKDFIDWRRDMSKKREIAVNNQAVFVNERFNPSCLKEIMTFVSKKQIAVDCYLIDGTKLTVRPDNNQIIRNDSVSSLYKEFNR